MFKEKKRTLEDLRIAAAQHAKEKNFWLNKLSGEWIKSSFPFDHRGNETKLSGNNLAKPMKFQLDENLSQKLIRLSSGSDNRLYMILISGLYLLLHMYTGNNDIIIGSPVYKQDIDVGLINTVVALRNRFEGDITFKQLLLQVRESLAEAIENYGYPIELLPEQLHLDCPGDDFPLFNTAILLRNIHDENYIHHLSLDIIFSFLRGEKSIGGEIRYNGLLYRESSIKRIAANFTHLLSIVISNIDSQVLGLELLSEEERNQILNNFNDTSVEYLAEKTIYRLFEAQVEKTPDNMALVFKEKQVTYKELNNNSTQIAVLLREKGIKPNCIVGIMVERSHYLTSGILAILKAGGAYLLLDPGYPRKRIEFMLKDSAVEIVMNVMNPRQMFGGENFGVKLNYLNLEEVQKISNDTSNLEILNRANDLAYIIYTSGTTGKPKGVMVEHGNLSSYLYAFSREFDIKQEDIVAQQISFSFDAFVEVLYPPLLKGGKIVVPTPDEAMDVLYLLTSFIVKHSVTIISCAPLVLNELNKREEIKTVRLFISGGDVLKKEYMKNLLEAGIVYNTYGPTEATVCATYYNCENCKNDTGSNVPIGKPISNYNIYIINNQLNLLPIGVPGELCISGGGIARGYLNNPELTREKFLNDPFKKGERIYRSGDHARWLPDGNIEFLGRKDQQISIRGFRIEAGEIENQLLGYSGIKGALVVDRQDSSGDRYLCAYIISDRKLPDTRLRKYLLDRVPSYAVPSFFVFLEQIPLKPNGKIDLKALPEPEPTGQPEIIYITEKMLDEVAEDSNDDLIEQDLIEHYISRGETREKILYPTDKTIHELFQEQVEKTPDRIAVVREHAAGCISYRELNVKANQLAHVLTMKGVKPGNIIGLLTEPSLELIIGILGILKAGAAYLPLDPGNPPQRIKYFMEDCVCTLLLTQKRFEDNAGTNVDVINLDDNSLYNHNLDGKNPGIYTLHGPVYVAYTSGSTGKPKGVAITHSNLCPLLYWGNDYFSSFAYEHVAQNIPFFFDLSVWEIFITLTSGSSLHIISTEIFSDFNEYVDFINTQGITVLHTTPTYFQFIAGMNREMKTLKYLSLGAEKLTYDLVEQSYKLISPQCRVFNTYGPTEATIRVSVSEVDRADGDKYEKLRSIPIGKGIANVDLLILDKYLKICPVYTNGELYIAGDALAHGYLNDPEKTSKSFVINPFKEKGVKGSYLYRTGDRVRRLPDGNIEFLERIDHQVKINGIRIEPGEIECALLQHPCINGAVTLVKEDHLGSKHICAFVLATEKLVQSHLREFLSKKLPHYMIPSYFLQLETFPMTRNGKIDRKTLSQYDFEKTSTIHYLSEEMLNQLDKKTGIFPVKQKTMDDGIIEETLPEEEKQQLLITFNQTAGEYPTGTTIHQLVEKQVEKTPHYSALVSQNQHLTYSLLNQKANQLARLLRHKGLSTSSIVALMVEPSLEMLIGMLGILKAGGIFMPVDNDIPEERQYFMLEDSRAEFLLANVDTKITGVQGEIIDLRDSRNYRGDESNLTLLNRPTDVAYILYTSGTTGKPKGVLLEGCSVVNLMEAVVAMTPIGEDDNILSLSPITFDVFSAETILPLSKGAKVVIGSPDYLINFETIAMMIEKEKITIHHSTPAFLQKFLSEPVFAASLNKLKYLGTAGEALNDSLLKKLQDTIKGRIFNLYGPAETTLYSTAKNVTADTTVTIGKPLLNTQVYILDRNRGLVPIGSPGELYIGGVGVARGYLNRPELTAEKFISNPFASVINNHQYPGTIDRIYGTGDLARWLPDGNIEFIGRIDHQVKLTGVRIEPGEIENSLLAYEIIDEVAVVVKENEEEEKFLCAFLVSGKRIDVADLRVWLSKKLPHYMIPAIFIQLEKMPLTPNRKINRKLLAAVDIEIDTRSYYVAPGDDIEEKMVGIWAAVLNKPKETISVNADFFEMGGHSLKAITIIAKTHKAFNVRVPMAEMFKTPSIRGVSQYIKKAKEERYTSIEPVEKNDYYLLSSAQKRIYILQQMELASTVYNMPEIIPLNFIPDLEKFKNTFIRLITRHESLRTSFHIVNDEPVQRVHDRVDFEISYYELSADDRDRMKVVNIFDSAFDLAQAPLLKVGIVKTVEAQYFLVVVMHHIISDGVSHQVLVNDFMTLFADDRDDVLPPLRIQYKDFSQWQNSRQEKNRIKNQETYWLKEFEGEIPVLNLPTDFPRSDGQLFKGSVLNGTIPIDTEKLKAVALENSATTFMVMLAIFYVFLYKMSGQEDIVIGTPVSGRRHADLEKIIGMFVNSLPLRNRPGGLKSFIGFLEEVKLNTLAAFENQEYQFEELVEKLLIKRDRHNPVFDVMFTCQEQELEGKTETEPREEILDDSLAQKSYEHFELRTSKFDLSLNIVVARKLLFSFEYSSELFEKRTIEIFADSLKKIVFAIMADENIKLKDINITTFLTDTDGSQIKEELIGMEF